MEGRDIVPRLPTNIDREGTNSNALISVTQKHGFQIFKSA